MKVDVRHIYENRVLSKAYITIINFERNFFFCRNYAAKKTIPKLRQIIVNNKKKKIRIPKYLKIKYTYKQKKS